MLELENHNQSIGGHVCKTKGSTPFNQECVCNIHYVPFLVAHSEVQEGIFLAPVLNIILLWEIMGGWDRVILLPCLGFVFLFVFGFPLLSLCIGFRWYFLFTKRKWKFFFFFNDFLFSLHRFDPYSSSFHSILFLQWFIFCRKKKSKGFILYGFYFLLFSTGKHFLWVNVSVNPSVRLRKMIFCLLWIVFP